MTSNEKNKVIEGSPLLSDESKKINKGDRQKYIQEKTQENISSIKTKSINYNSINEIKLAITINLT